jgi:hypothetical protein
VPKRLLEQAAAAGEPGMDGEFEEDDSELVFDDVGPEVRGRFKDGLQGVVRQGNGHVPCRFATVHAPLPLSGIQR